jgi:hypothetical protein
MTLPSQILEAGQDFAIWQKSILDKNLMDGKQMLLG